MTDDKNTDSEKDDLPEIMTIDQAAEYLQLHKQVLYRHVRKGTVPVSRVGRTIRFKRSVLDAWLERTAWESVGLEPPEAPQPPPKSSFDPTED